MHIFNETIDALNRMTSDFDINIRRACVRVSRFNFIVKFASKKCVAINFNLVWLLGSLFVGNKYISNTQSYYNHKFPKELIFIICKYILKLQNNILLSQSG